MIRNVGMQTLGFGKLVNFTDANGVYVVNSEDVREITRKEPEHKGIPITTVLHLRPSGGETEEKIIELDNNEVPVATAIKKLNLEA